jgi:hypothetical protein
MDDFDLSAEHVVRAAEALIAARETFNVSSSREQALQEALKSAIQRYWARQVTAAKVK